MKRQTLTVVVVVLLANPLLAAPAAAQSMGSGGPLSPVASDTVGFFGYDTPDQGTMYGSQSDKVGVFVETETQEDLNALENWANSSDDRTVLERYDARNTSLVAVAPDNIRYSLTDSDRYRPGSGQPLAALGYVERVDIELRMDNVEPLTNLDNESSFEEPPGATAATVFDRDASFSDGMAWDENSNESHISEVRDIVDADQVAANGTGVNIAIIDTGANVEDGRLAGNGSIGSDLRVTDAYDFVADEPANAANNYDNVSDPNGHGTWVLSAAAGADGVAPGANIQIYRALDEDGSGATSDISAAVRRADRQGADIIVMSLGSPLHNDQLANDLQHVLSDDGNVTAVTVAAGNSYTTGAARWTASPADVGGVIGVQSTNATDPANASKSYYGNVGPDTGADGSDGETRGVAPDTAAPGQEVSTPIFTSSGSFRNRTLSGTSMSNPVVAGVAALALGADSSLIGESERFHDLVVDTGADTPNLGITESEGGMINAKRLINKNTTDPAPNRDLNDKAGGRDTGNRNLSAQPNWIQAASRGLDGLSSAVSV